MSIYRTIARASATLSVAALLGAGAAVAQPLGGSADGDRALSARSEALNAQHGLGVTGAGTEADPFTACRAVGAPMSLERFLCYRAAANLANERFTRPSAPSKAVIRPIVISGTGFDWPDAGIGFGAAAGLALLAAGTGVALRSLGG
jgi:hypothetical protein